MGNPRSDMEMHSGMSLRDYFAAHAPPVPGWFWKNKGRSEWCDAEMAAEWNYVWADCMIKARGGKR